MLSYIDIHSHILPGLDDGAENMEISLSMLRQAQAEGIREIILTPHYKPMRRNPSPERVMDTLERLKKRMGEEGIGIKLHLGNEIYYSREVLGALQEEKAFTMAGSSYVLVEFGPMEAFSYIRDAAYSLFSEGYYPILAHVERYAGLMKRKDKMEELLDMGCLVQVNAGSVMGNNGYNSRRDVKWLLKRKYVHFVASDGHDDKKRTIKLAEAAAYVGRRYGEDYSRHVFYDNADKLLGGGYL